MGFCALLTERILRSARLTSHTHRKSVQRRSRSKRVAVSNKPADTFPSSAKLGAMHSCHLRATCKSCSIHRRGVFQLISSGAEIWANKVSGFSVSSDTSRRARLRSPRTSTHRTHPATPRATSTPLLPSAPTPPAPFLLTQKGSASKKKGS